MAGVAVGMLAIMLIVGRPDPPARPATTTAPAQRRAPIAFATIRTACECSRRRRCETRRPTVASAERPAGAVRRHAASAAARPDRRRSKAARIREPLRQQRRPQPASRERAAGHGSAARRNRMRPHRRMRRTRPSTRSPTRLSERTHEDRWPRGEPDRAAPAASRQRPCRRHAPADGAAPSTPDQTPRDQRRRAAAPRPRRHGHRHRADESAGWHRAPRPVNCLVTNALYSHSGTSGAHPRRRARSRRNEARAGVRRDAARRRPSIAC